MTTSLFLLFFALLYIGSLVFANKSFIRKNISEKVEEGLDALFSGLWLEPQEKTSVAVKNDDVKELEKRIEVLEKIATCPKQQLSNQIDNL